MHEVEGEDVRVASGINETMGRDIAELLKLEVKKSSHFLSRLIFSFLCWDTSRGAKKEQVRQCLGFCTADFQSWLIYKSAVQ